MMPRISITKKMNTLITVSNFYFNAIGNYFLKQGKHIFFWGGGGGGTLKLE